MAIVFAALDARLLVSGLVMIVLLGWRCRRHGPAHPLVRSRGAIEL
jgi:hypothetical protein